MFTIWAMKKSMITSLSNPLIKQARSLRQKKARRESRLFLVEGIHHVGEVVEAGWEVDSILYAPDLLTSSFAHDLIFRLKANLQPVTPQVMDSLTDKENPQGILAIVHQKQTRVDELKKYSRVMALVSPQDPGNVGTILRTMDAVEADALFILDGGVELYNPSVVRASMGALFWIPVVQASFGEFVHWAKKNNISLVGTSAHGTVDYQSLHPKQPWCLVLGNEQKGLSDEQLVTCEQVVSLPMKGRISSLNLSVAAGILMYHLIK